VQFGAAEQSTTLRDASVALIARPTPSALADFKALLIERSANDKSTVKSIIGIGVTRVVDEAAELSPYTSEAYTTIVTEKFIELRP